MFAAFHRRHVFEIILAADKHGRSDHRRKAHHAADVTSKALEIEHTYILIGLRVYGPRTGGRAEIYNQTK